MAEISSKVKKYARDKKRATRRKSVVTSLAAVVVFCTTYALILPALTMSGKTYCGLEEHTHSEACYGEVSVLTCTIPEEVHVHSDACYKVESVLVCTLAEDENHTHTEACYETKKTLVCGLEEGTAHVHGESCYQLQQGLICTQPEHTHTLQCYSNPNADLESAEVWQRMLNGIKFTGNAGEDAITFANTQIGYCESVNNYIVAADGVTTMGYTRYGDWAGTPYSQWDALFCGFVLDYAGVTAGASFPVSVSAGEWVNSLAANGMYAGVSSGYIPAPGDLIFFDIPDANGLQDGVADRVGFVLEYGEFIKTIEGDLNNSVAVASYVSYDSTILGYGILPAADQTAEEQTAEETAEAQSNVSVITATASDGAVVTITGVLPEGAVAVITPVQITEEQYARLIETYGEEKAAVIAANYAAYDICIMVDGVEWEPDESVSVVVSKPAVEAEGEYEVAHVEADNSVSAVDASTGSEGDVSFEADGFSVYIFFPLVEGEDEEGAYLRAVADDGLTVTIRGGAEVFPFPVEELSVSIIDIEGSEEELALLAAEGVDVENSRLVDISIWHGTEMVEPAGSVKVTVSVPEIMGSGAELEQVAHITGEGQVEILPLESGSEGRSFETESFSTYSFTITSQTNTGVFYIATGDVLELTGTTGYYHSWTSGTAATATVSGTNLNNGYTSNSTVGTVTALAEGSTTITHTYKKNANSRTAKTESVTVNVQAAENLTVEVGSALTLPGSATGTWASENVSIATVANGVVTGVAEGSVSISCGTTYYQVTVTAAEEEDDDDQGGGGSGSTGTSSGFDHNKSIDYLGDGSSDSSSYTNLSGSDYYRLYLDMTGDTVPTDLLLVLDLSNSMDRDNSTGSKTVTTSSRLDNILAFLNGDSTTTGFGEYFLSLNSSNKLAIMSFAGGVGSVSGNTATIKGWNDTLSTYNLTTDTFSGTGTNYCDALTTASSILSQVSGDNNRKIMIFLSDGAPTTYTYNNTEYRKTGSTGVYDTGSTDGVATYYKITDEGEKLPTKITETRTYSAINNFKTSNSNVTIYTICYLGMVDDQDTKNVCSQMLTNLSGSVDRYFEPENAAGLREKLEGIFKPYNVVITDYLSSDVEYYSTQPDVVVTRTDESTGAEEILYNNGVTSVGTGVIDSVTYTATADSADSTGYVTCKFVEGTSNTLLKGYVYTLSFNVKLTDSAKAKGANYTDTGADTSDWGSNTTSAGQGGFYSNKSANVSYKVGSENFSEAYEKPVVQVDPLVIVRKVINATDKTGSFPFSITYTDIEGVEHTETFTLNNYDASAATPSEYRVTVKPGSTATITETDPEDYDVTYTLNAGESVEGESCSAKNIQENQIVVFTNTKEEVPDVLEYNKTIDYLGDGGKDSKSYTDLSGSDCYRLYLDVTYDDTVTDTLTYDVAITDWLSNNVTYYSALPDLILVRKSITGGTEEVLWKDGAATSAGSGIIQNVSYTATPDDTASPGYVKAEFVSGSALPKGYTYTVSFNVELSEIAENKGTNYTDIGAAGTDWGKNSTSSGKDGFFSNTKATLEYTVDSKEYHVKYARPVVQANNPAVTIRKLVASSDKSGTFSFTVSYTGADGVEVNRVISLTNYDPTDDTPAEFVVNVKLGTDVTVTEGAHTGYTVSYTVNGGDSSKGNTASVSKVKGNQIIVFTNTPGAELPRTGGSGTGFIYAAGTALIIISAAGYILIRRRREAQGE